MPGVGSLVARLRGCPTDCTFWAGDSVEWRDPKMGRPWHPTGRVVGPSDLPKDAWPPAPDATGDEILRGAIGAVVGTQPRVLVDWHGTPDAGVHNTPTAWLRHSGPCPPLFAPGMKTRVERPGFGDLEAGDIVRVTGIAASGVMTVQAPDGRHGEVYRSQLAPPFVGPRAP